MPAFEILLFGAHAHSQALSLQGPQAVVIAQVGVWGCMQPCGRRSHGGWLDVTCEWREEWTSVDPRVLVLGTGEVVTLSYIPQDFLKTILNSGLGQSC